MLVALGACASVTSTGKLCAELFEQLMYLVVKLTFGCEDVLILDVVTPGL